MARGLGRSFTYKPLNYGEVFENLHETRVYTVSRLGSVRVFFCAMG